MLLSSLFFTLSTYFGKLVSNYTEMDAVITSFLRNFLGVLGIGLFMYLKGISFKPVKKKPLYIRSALNSLAFILLTGSLNFTTITNANMINLTYPVFVFLLARFITGEVLKPSAFVYLLLILVGSYIVSDPHLKSFNIGDLIAFGSAFFTGTSILYLTETRKTESTVIIVFYLMIFGLFLNFPLVINDIGLLSMDSIGIVLLAAAASFLGQAFTTRGCKYVDSATGSMLSSSRMLMAALIGFFFLSEPLNFRIVMGIILISIALVGVSGYYKKVWIYFIRNKKQIR